MSAKVEKAKKSTAACARSAPSVINKEQFKTNLEELRNIHRLKRSQELLSSKAPFRKMVIALLEKIGGKDKRIQAHAIALLQEASEAFLINIFEGSSLLCTHAGRKTLLVEDMRLIQRF